MEFLTTTRLPTKAELKELVEFMVRNERNRYSVEDIEQEMTLLACQNAIATFPNYYTGAPGFSGKLAIVVAGFSPGHYEVYGWNKGKLMQMPFEAQPPKDWATARKQAGLDVDHY
jgi:hypothetical protein